MCSSDLDKNGIIHCAIGKVSFEVDALKENLESLLADLNKAKPSSTKGIYLEKISLSTTMGPGIAVDQSSLLHNYLVVLVRNRWFLLRVFEGFVLAVNLNRFLLDVKDRRCFFRR